MRGHMLLEGLLDAGQEGVYGLLTLGMGHCSGDVQKTDYGVSVVIVLQGLSPVYRDKGTPSKKGGGSSFTVTKLPSSLEPKGQKCLSLPHSP